MKLGSVTKLDNRNSTSLKILTMAFIPVNFSNLWPIWSNPKGGFCRHSLVKRTFSLKGTFHPTKTENRTKTSLTHLSPTALSKYTILAENIEFLQKKKII